MTVGGQSEGLKGLRRRRYAKFNERHRRRYGRKGTMARPKLQNEKPTRADLADLIARRLDTQRDLPVLMLEAARASSSGIVGLDGRAVSSEPAFPLRIALARDDENGLLHLFIADPDTLENAGWIGTFNLDVVSEDPELFENIKQLMARFLARVVVHLTGAEDAAGLSARNTEGEAVRACRKCGCTAGKACRDRQGHPCRWVALDLCSSCA